MNTDVACLAHQVVVPGEGLDYWMWWVAGALVPFHYLSIFKAGAKGFATLDQIEPYRMSVAQ